MLKRNGIENMDLRPTIINVAFTLFFLVWTVMKPSAGPVTGLFLCSCLTLFFIVHDNHGGGKDDYEKH